MSQNTTKIKVELDPWLKNKDNRKDVPLEAQLVCSYELHIGIDSITETAYLNRTDIHDELWLLNRGRVARMTRAGSPQSAARRLLKLHIRSGVGHQWPIGFYQEGLIKEDEFWDLVQSLEEGLDRNSKAATEATSPIVDMAELLGLNPSPHGQIPGGMASVVSENRTP